MNNLNLTFDIIRADGEKTLKTYYSITAISKIENSNTNRCMIHSNGEQDICLMSFEELHAKLTKVQNESTSR
jgi:hypothetical protein